VGWISDLPAIDCCRSQGPGRKPGPFCDAPTPNQIALRSLSIWGEIRRQPQYLCGIKVKEAAMANATWNTCAAVVLAAALFSPIAGLAQAAKATAQPAQQVSAELAKKCREMAVKAHPTQLAGTSPYAAAQREYFRECVAKGGNVDK
jgi:hypothetical protein